MKGNKFINDNTKKILGFDYQKLLALEYCLNAKKNESIWIECYGDIANLDTSTEIKHHLDLYNNTSNSVDIWKTICNYVKEFDNIQLFDNLILHTTAIAKSDSIFFNWNNLQSEKKYDLLINHSPSKTIKKFFDIIRNFQKSDLIEILCKFKILEGQVNVLEKWNELKEHNSLDMVIDSYKDDAIKKLYGYITKKAIDNSDKWQININDFKIDKQDMLSIYTKGDIPFPIIENASINNNVKYKFVDKMIEIKLKEIDKQNAISDYLRAGLSQMDLLEKSPTIKDNLELYDENVKRMLEDEKSGISVSISEEKIRTENSLVESKTLYFKCITSPHEQIIGVNNTQKYYRNGRIHDVLEISNFEWKFSLDDL
jgi:hypothetical protein